jgi:uncharacterized membrane protein HdeD (DUF308 family)
MRKLFSLICSSALLLAGFYFVFIAFEHPTPYTVIRTFGLGVVFSGIASVWLWEDFLSSAVHKFRLLSRNRPEA